MKSLIRHIVARTYKPLLVKYLSKTRTYKYDDIELSIPPQVFHPGFFFSTRLLLNYISPLPLQGKNFFELGCGSGLISIYAAKKGANVTASDINLVAIEFLQKNSRNNHVELKIIQSNLFQEIPVLPFDIIVINPPYYKKKPVTELDYAWFCGENGEYFSSLFERLGNYIHAESEVFMSLFEGCDVAMIKEFAAQNGFELNCVQTHTNLLEKNFVFSIKKIM